MDTWASRVLKGDPKPSTLNPKSCIPSTLNPIDPIWDMFVSIILPTVGVHLESEPWSGRRGLDLRRGASVGQGDGLGFWGFRV